MTLSQQPLRRDGPAEPVTLTDAQLAALVRQLSHDLRNELNFIEVELTLLAETTCEPETRDAANRLREALRHSDGMVRSFSSQLIPEARSVIPAGDLAENWRRDVTATVKDTLIAWEMSAGEAAHFIEARVIRSILTEMVKALRLRYANQSLQARCWTDKIHAIYEVTTTSKDKAEVSLEAPPGLLWTALQRLAARSDGQLSALPPGGIGPQRVRLELPIHALSSSIAPK